MSELEGTVLSPETVRRVLEVVAPGSTLARVSSLGSGGTNFAHRVEACAADGKAFQIVIRRYGVSGDYDRGAKAVREFRVLEAVGRRGLPVPRPLYLDQAGAVLGLPGIVTECVDAAPLLACASAADPLAWARNLAITLAGIHAVPVDAGLREVLLDANAEALWFLAGGIMPGYVQAHPLGPTVWTTLSQLVPRMKPAPAGLVHVDYWLGNVLWQQERPAAVQDWEEAAIGDGGIDVGYCRLDIVLNGNQAAADEFLRAYETETGRSVANLELWELAAAIRPMVIPEGWVAESPNRERFAEFVASALVRLEAG